MDVATYLNKLLTNEAIRGKVLKHFSSLMVRILSHPACSIVPQIEFDLDLTEVSNGFFFHIPTRVFIRNAIPAEKCGETSPRAFVPYNCETPPEPGYCREGILNSFPDPVSAQTSATSLTNVSWHSKCPIKYGNSLWLVLKIQGRRHGHQFSTAS